MNILNIIFYFILYIYPIPLVFVFHIHFPSLSFSLTFSPPKRPSLCSNGRPAHRRPDRRVQGGLQPLRQGWRWSLSSDPSLSFFFFLSLLSLFSLFPRSAFRNSFVLGGMFVFFVCANFDIFGRLGVGGLNLYDTYTW